MKNRAELLRIDRDPALRTGSYVGMFDLPKGLLMILIIAFHSTNDYSWLVRWIFAQPLPLRVCFSLLSLVHYGLIPALFMICGFGERKENIANNLRRHALPLIKPYICVTIITMIFVPLRQILSGAPVMDGLREQGLAFLLGLHLRLKGVGIIGPLWFPVTYAVASLLLNLLLRLRKKWLRWLLLVVGAVLAALANRLLVPFCVQQAIICAGLMYVGMGLRLRKSLAKRLPAWLCVLIWLLCIAGMSVGGYVEFSIVAFSYSLLDLALAYAAGYVLLRLLMQLNALQGKLADAIRWIGRHMFWICCVHTAVRLAAPWESFVALFEPNRIPGYLVEFLIQITVALAGCRLLDHYMRKHHSMNERKYIV